MCISNLKNMKKDTDYITELNKFIGFDIATNGNEVENVDVIPTGIRPLDFILGIGGIPRGGKITDIYGLPSVGKSTICYTLIAQAQQQGIKCALIDGENSYTKEYPEGFGVDTNELIVVTPTCLEQAGEAIEWLAKNEVGLIVVDSTATLVPRALAEAEHGKAPMALQARGISQMLQKLMYPLKEANCGLVFVSQMRANIMAMHQGDKYTTSGGYSLRFYSHIRIEMKRLKTITVKEEVVGYVVQFKIIKNKLSRPGLTCDIPYIYDAGFEKEGDLLDMSLAKGLLKREGNSYFYGDTKLGVGKEKALAAVNANASLKEELIAAIFPPQ